MWRLDWVGDVIHVTSQGPNTSRGAGERGEDFRVRTRPDQSPTHHHILRTLDFLAAVEVEVLEGHRLQGLEMT